MSEEGARAGLPLSIVQLCAPAGIGGLERVVQGLATGLHDRGHRVTLLTVSSPEAQLDDFLSPIRRAGVPVHSLRGRGRQFVREIRRVRDELRILRPDVLHTHGYRSDLLHGGHARRAGIATVTTLHGSSRMGGWSHLFEALQERALRRFDAVITVSEPLTRSLRERGVQPARLHEIPNAWTPPAYPLSRGEARRALKVDRDALVIGWVGRLIPIKGCDLFLEALARIEGPGWTARIVGDGPERDGLEALAADLGLTERVRFLGTVPDAARTFAGLDLFVLSSRSEGTPMVLLEAMGAGRPVVATAVGGVPDVLRDPVEGWTVSALDVSALARAIRGALESAEERVARGGRARRRVEESYGFDRWIRRHERAYSAALAEPLRK